MKKNTLFLGTFVIGFFFVLSSCKQGQKKNQPTAVMDTSEEYQEGLALVSETCLTCHAPQEQLQSSIAPPLIAVKKHYLEGFDTEEAFVKQMSNFLLSPNIENSQMPNAIEKFGLMPNLGLSKDQLEAAATYIYRASIEQPKWFATHQKEEQQALLKHSETGVVPYLRKGMSLALATKSVLGKNLLAAIQTQGTTGALAFCNEKAIPLTDSMATKLQASIKRVSDNNRNPDNTASAEELAYIKLAKADLQQNGQAMPKVFENGDKMVGYYPILTNQMCLQCHGDPASDIEPKTLETIRVLYPNDKAMGYAENELRGIWVIEMNKLKGVRRTP